MTGNVETAAPQSLAHRPHFHFAPLAKWMNDPNGMVYLDGEYHLFYQYYPDDIIWGPMHWGHAVSYDMIHWQHLPIALYPDELGYIFSGSAVADVNNTAGFKNGEITPLVAIFTYHDPIGEKAERIDYQTQGIAYSTDRGRSWTKYAGNPIIKNPGMKDFRDPKVMWYEPGQHWVMSLAAGDKILFYKSANLIDWTLTGSFGEHYGAHGGVWECPDLLELPVEGSSLKKWVLLVSINPGGPNGGSATQYFIGNFDGKTFISENPVNTELWIDFGTDNYAGVTWSNVPVHDGRCLFIGWMSNWNYGQKVPTTTWRSAMTVPRSLHLRETAQGIRLISQPVKELETLHEAFIPISTTAFTKHSELSAIQFYTYELYLEFDLEQTKAADFGVALYNHKNEKVRIGYDVKARQFYIDRNQSGKIDFSDNFVGRQLAPRFSEAATLKMHLIVDVASVELFADDGATVMTAIFFPNEDFNKAALFSDHAITLLQSGKVTRLNPAEFK
ncbi:MAG: glycoside hydrolase family 32 protein [Saprospiraceae bacterium]